jgi:hypothetical protein
MYIVPPRSGDDRREPDGLSALHAKPGGRVSWRYQGSPRPACARSRGYWRQGPCDRQRPGPAFRCSLILSLAAANLFYGQGATPKIVASTLGHQELIGSLVPICCPLRYGTTKDNGGKGTLPFQTAAPRFLLSPRHALLSLALPISRQVQERMALSRHCPRAT